jgi:hypothetical protein
MQKKRELKPLDQQQLQKVRGGTGLPVFNPPPKLPQPQPWLPQPQPW